MIKLKKLLEDSSEKWLDTPYQVNQGNVDKSNPDLPHIHIPHNTDLSQLLDIYQNVKKDLISKFGTKKGKLVAGQWFNSVARPILTKINNSNNITKDPSNPNSIFEYNK